MSRLTRGIRSRVFRTRCDEEGGFFLVFFSIILVVMLGFAGFAVDFASWSYEGQQQQKAADAAALAGAVYLPDNVPLAMSTAQQVASANGYTDGANGGKVHVTIVQGSRPSQLKVTISNTIDTIFARAVGVKVKTVSRTATAEYTKPVAMGSPSAQFGNDPYAGMFTTRGRRPGFWGNIAGPDSPKENGDAYQAGTCSFGDNCSGGHNSDYDQNGYYYTVRVGPGAPGSMTIQAFDPAFVAVGDICGANDDNSNLIGAAGLNKNSVPGYPTAGDLPSVRYAPVTDATNPNDPGMQYCTGDHIFDTSNPPPATTYKVFGPASVPGNPASAPSTPICSVTFPGWYAGMDHNAINKDLVSRLKSNVPFIPSAPVAGQNTTFGAIFRAWYPICQLSPSQGDYFVQVSTSASSGSGHNRFSLCASTSTSSCAPASNVGLFGNAKMSIYANVGSNTTTEFYLARVLPGAPGRTLTLSLFDIGDAPSAGTTGSLTIVRTTDGNDTPLSSCTYSPPASSSTNGPPWNSFQPTPGSCSITGVSSSQYNGRWIQVKLPIPSSLNSCNVSDPNDCWVSIQYRFNGSLNDTTSWTASIDGDPVRLVH